MHRIIAGTLALLCLGLPAEAQRTIYVDAANPNCPGSGTLADPFCTIQPAMDAAVNGDTVLVADGVYRGGACFCGKAVVLRSVNGPDRCVIDAGGSGPALWFVAFEPPDARTEGFTVTNGNNNTGGGVFCHHDSKPTFVNCVFAANRADSGGAVFCDTASAPLFVDCAFFGNTARLGAGAFLVVDFGAQPTFVNCAFAGNVATIDGGAVYSSGRSEPRLFNCTLYGNSAGTSGGAAFVSSLASATLINSIAWDNRPDQIVGPATVTFSDVQGGHPGLGNINIDPRLVAGARLDFHLRADSPCIDAGTAINGLPLTDFEGDPRSAFAAIDIGADEFFPHLYHRGAPNAGATFEAAFIGPASQPAFWALAQSTIDPGLSIPGLSGLMLLDPSSLVVLPAGTTPASGLIVRTVAVPPSLPPANIPTQALIGLQFTALDLLLVR